MIGFNESFNYLDPGTGSFLMQFIAAAALSFTVYFKSISAFIKEKLKKLKKK